MYKNGTLVQCACLKINQPQKIKQGYHVQIKQLEIKNKILEKSNFDEVFDSNDLDASNYSDYNSIKDAVHSKLRN